MYTIPHLLDILSDTLCVCVCVCVCVCALEHYIAKNVAST